MGAIRTNSHIIFKYFRMNKYQPLSYMFVDQNVDTQSYHQKVIGEEEYWCYSSPFFHGLKYVRESGGIPIANEWEMGKKEKKKLVLNAVWEDRFFRMRKHMA